MLRQTFSQSWIEDRCIQAFYQARRICCAVAGCQTQGRKVLSHGVWSITRLLRLCSKQTPYILVNPALPFPLMKHSHARLRNWHAQCSLVMDSPAIQPLSLHAQRSEQAMTEIMRLPGLLIKCWQGAHPVLKAAVQRCCKPAVAAPWLHAALSLQKAPASPRYCC